MYPLQHDGSKNHRLIIIIEIGTFVIFYVNFKHLLFLNVFFLKAVMCLLLPMAHSFKMFTHCISTMIDIVQFYYQIIETTTIFILIKHISSLHENPPPRN